MSPYTFAGWLVVALATLVAAIVVTLGQPGPASVGLENEVAFPALRADPNAVRLVRIESGGTSFSLERRDDGEWVSPEKDGYPVDTEQVRKMIVGLSDMRLVEAKTIRADRFARLQVEDVGAEGAESRLLRLEGEGEEALVEVIVGKARSRFTGGVEGGTYVRRPGEQQAWLASGRVEVKVSVDDWLRNDIMHLPSDSIRRVEVTPPAGGTPESEAAENRAIVLERPEPDGEVALEGLPEGRVVDSSQTSRLLSGLSFLTLDDVAPRSRFELPEARRRGVFTTYDGVEITVQLVALQDSDWALFSARFLEPEGQSEDEAAAARRQAEEIAARVEGWLYKLPSHVVERLSVPFDSLHRAGDGTS